MQLIFITGKGGVGKSAVAAGLATILASEKCRVGVVELGESRMSDFFNCPPVDYDGAAFSPHITLFNIDAPSSFREYAGRRLPRHLAGLLENKWVRSFTDAAPGLNEILLLGKIHALATEGDFDFILVDAPATGHAISLCDAPRIATAVLKHGPLKATVETIWSFLHDASQTRFLIVTQPEPGIVQETFELHTHLSKTLQLSVRDLVVNGLFAGGKFLSAKIPGRVPTPARSLAVLVRLLRAREEKQARILKDLKKSLPLPLTTIARWDVAEEFHLRQAMALQLKQWALKNCSTKRN